MYSQVNGKVIGYNDDSGILYKTMNGLQQFALKSNIIPMEGLNIDNYQNKENEENLIESMNADEIKEEPEVEPDDIKLSKDELIQDTPPNEPKTGGKDQEDLLDNNKQE